MDFGDLFDRSPNPYMVVDRNLRYVAMNQAYEAAVGHGRDALLGVGLFEAFPGDGSELGNANVALLRQSLQRVLRTGRRDVLSLIRYAIPRPGPDGIVMEDRYWSATHTPLFDARGEVAWVLQHTTDVTGMRRLKQALAEATGASSEQIEQGMFERAREVQEHNRTLELRLTDLETLFAQAPGFMAYLSGPEHRFAQVNRAYEELVGSGRPLIGLPLEEALPEAVAQGFLDLLNKVYVEGKAHVGRGVRIYLQREAGQEPEEVVVDFVYQPVRDARGRVKGIFVQGNDTTTQAAAQEELARFHANLSELVDERTEALRVAEEERRQAQAALHQAQKLEAIGKLTGGVAHDFNNLLQVVGANLELIESHGLPDAARERMASARAAVQRGARLVSQLMAFARQDAPSRTSFNPAQVVRRLADMIERVLGEGHEVVLELALDDCEVHIEANLQQFETTLLNMVINARDAMPEGGRVRVECQQVKPSGDASQGSGELRLVVSDTGVGMTPEVKARIFDPFFTTKPPGRGTGLGLAAVYGFVQQSGGRIGVESEPGKGTVFTLHLPVSSTGTSPMPAVTPAAPLPRGRQETVLLVEDEDGVRKAGAEILEALGYRVVQATHAAMALTLLESGLRPALLFTDVVMPGPLHSFELVEAVRARWPGIAVLMTSGYAEGLMSRNRGPRPDVLLLDKPYGSAELARLVRAAIDGHGAPASLHVLLVDDDPDDRLLTGELLTSCGLTVSTARNAEEAMACLASTPCDVLMTDVELPGCDGIELAARARAQRPDLPVVFVSGHQEDVIQARGGQGTVLSKPFSRSRLLAALALVQQHDASAGDAGESQRFRE